MRRLLLILALLACSFSTTACTIDCCDWVHPRPRATMPSCDCLPCNQRPDYSESIYYP